MPDGLLPIIILIVVIVLYAIAKIRVYVRKSAKQWEQVDKSKLREWDDDD